MEAKQAVAEAERRDKQDAIRAILFRVSIDDLSEFTRTVGQMDGRWIAGIAADFLRQRQRARNTVAAGTPLESTEKPAKTRGRPKATLGQPEYYESRQRLAEAMHGN